MSREAHVQFCEGLAGKFRRPTLRGKLRKGKWGIKEIKLSANFLRMRDTDSLVDKTNIGKNDLNKPLIQLSCYDKNGQCKTAGKCSYKEKNVAFTVYLRKPKEVCIVYDKCKNDSTINALIDKENNLKSFGITLLSIKDLQDYVASGKNIPHRFLVFHTSDLSEDLEMDKYRERLPYRIISNDTPKKSKANKGNKKTSSEKLINDVRAQVNFALLKDFDAEKLNQFINQLYQAYITSKKLGNAQTISIVNDGVNLAQKWGVLANGNKIVFDDHGRSCEEAIIKDYSYYHPFGQTIGSSFDSFIRNVDSYEKKNQYY